MYRIKNYPLFKVYSDEPFFHDIFTEYAPIISNGFASSNNANKT